MTSLAFVTLCIVAIMVSTTSAQGGIASCCRTVSNTNVHRDRLKSYYKQDKSACPIDAVVFYTVVGRRICSDPHKLWTMTSMAYLDGKNWQVQQMTQRHN
ncbi:hypothetical protein L3Q82_021573 [Scortum barcoo]|uniref:Uncharacterized protein n=1 Tax=Scortum barcoo TaxID=214431 RepID=A0ACB8X683_9TELE|nr:hypothetical protein L3Q82_021573 [Scortum barcoo]